MRVNRYPTVFVAAAAAATALVAFPAVAGARPHNGTIAYGAPVPCQGDSCGYSSAIYGIEPDGTGLRRLVSPTPRFDGGATGPEWSVNGEKLLFARYRGTGAPPDVTRDLWFSTPSGGRITRVPLGLGLIGFHGYAWAPDGNRIVFAARHAGSRRAPTLYTIRLDGSQRQRLGRGERPSWSPDGRHIAFARRNKLETVSRLFVVRPDGRALRRLTSSDHDSWPSFSPDSRRVLFTRYLDTIARADEWRTVAVTGSHDRLVVAHPDSGQPGTFSHPYCPPHWTPDGQRLAAVRWDPLPSGLLLARLMTVTPTGNDERAEFTFPQLHAPCEFSWQPR